MPAYADDQRAGAIQVGVISVTRLLAARPHPHLPLGVGDRVAPDPERRVECDGVPQLLLIGGVRVVVAAANDVASGLDAAEVAARVIRPHLRELRAPLSDSHWEARVAQVAQQEAGAHPFATGSGWVLSPSSSTNPCRRSRWSRSTVISARSRFQSRSAPSSAARIRSRYQRSCGLGRPPSSRSISSVRMRSIRSASGG
jgi:hypothetical protein